MAMDETATAWRSAHSKVPPSRHTADPVAIVSFVEFEPSVSAVSAGMGLLDNVPTGSLFEAIEDQRQSLLNVLDIVHCIGVGVTSADDNPAPEISIAFELLEREIQRVAAALQKISLRSAMRLISWDDELAAPDY
jgi:hypothetical protein